MGSTQNELSIRVTGEFKCCSCYKELAVSDAHLSIISVRGANALAKRYLYNLPDPFAVLTIDDSQTYTSKTVKKTLSPSWNEHFDVSVSYFSNCNALIGGAYFTIGAVPFVGHLSYQSKSSMHASSRDVTKAFSVWSI